MSEYNALAKSSPETAKSTKALELDDAISAMTYITRDLDALIQELTGQDTPSGGEKDDRTQPVLIAVLQSGPKRLHIVRQRAQEQISYLRDLLI